MRIITTDNASATQTEHPTRATIRTVLQATIALAAAAPLIYQAITDQSPETAAGAGAVFLGVAAAITRLSAVPIVEKALRQIGLGAAPKELTFGHWDAPGSDEADEDDLIPFDPDTDVPEDEQDVQDDDEDQVWPDDPLDGRGPEEIEVEHEVIEDLDDPDMEALAAAEVDLTPPPPGYAPRH